ncbi:MAG: Crp/Fnr family transcriptional regulator, partial [Bacteroidales bacterium]|nr:Crp/Fnr family transcriptional regulator [Bacteroidales bacterium]
ITCNGCGSKSVPFTKLLDDELMSMQQKRVEIEYRRGETIAKQGHHATHIFYLQDGLVKIYKEISRKDNLILSLFPSGTFMALPTLFSSDILPYSIAAIEDSIVCSIEKKTIEAMILRNGMFAAEIIKCLNQCNLYHFDKIVSLTRKQMNGKMAELLLFVSENIYHADRFYLTLSRKDIAEFTGLSVMSVIRGIQEFKKSGLIQDSKGWIEIKEKEALRKICQSG